MNQIQVGSPGRRIPLHVGKPQVMLLSPSDWVYAQLVVLHLSGQMLSLTNENVISQFHLQFITHILFTLP